MAAGCTTLSRLSARVQRWVGRQDDVRLLGLDRFAVGFRVRSRQGCYDLRGPLASLLSTPADFAPAVAHLPGCAPA